MPAPEPHNGEAVDLSNCDREPIHVPGSIQPHGCLLACDDEGVVVERHSANAAAMLRVDHPLVGSTLDAVLGPEAAHALRNGLAAATASNRPALLFGIRVAAGSFDLAVHRHMGHVIVEFEPAGTEGVQPLELTRLLIARLGDIDDVDVMTEAAARLVRGLLGYDRVMIYRFEEDGAGKVVSEAKRGGLLGADASTFDVGGKADPDISSGIAISGLFLSPAVVAGTGKGSVEIGEKIASVDLDIAPIAIRNAHGVRHLVVREQVLASQLGAIHTEHPSRLV